MAERSSYAERRAFFDRLLTVYGRKPALEALNDDSLHCHTLHLAHTNRGGGIIDQLIQRAGARGVQIREHSRQELSRISRNGKQDQGVALDILCPAFQSTTSHLASLPDAGKQRLLALDGITNPQNLGMIVRSATAGNIDGIIWSRRGNAGLGPLVIKASAGTLYRAPMLLSDNLPASLEQYRDAGAEVCILEANASLSLFDHRPEGHCIYVLGNETEGVSGTVTALADRRLSIPMGNGVESLNVAVSASLIAYLPYLER